MLSPDLIATAYNRTGSIRGAARELGFDDHTLRRWAARDPRIKNILYAEKPPVMKILALDIETRPNLALVWDLWQKNVPPSAVTEATTMLCWAAKWMGESKVYFKSVFHDTQPQMILDMWDLLDEADAVVHYNGQKFDIPYINMEIARAGLRPPSPFQHIDLLKIVRKNFNFPSNKLALVSKEFGLEGKVEHEGFPLWIKCMNDDPEAWARMKSYNIQDVKLLEPLYEKLLPWSTGVASYGPVVSGEVCPACGSQDLKPKGYAYTRTGRYQRYVCGTCGKWSRGTKRNASTGVTAL